MTLYLGDRKAILPDMTIQSAKVLGITLDSPRKDGTVLGFVGFGGGNRSGNLEFRFRDNRLKTFRAFCAHSRECNFKLSLGGGKSFSFPVSQEDLERSIPTGFTSKDDFHL